jgi:hypothetical protein
MEVQKDNKQMQFSHAKEELSALPINYQLSRLASIKHQQTSFAPTLLLHTTTFNFLLLFIP